MEKEKEIMALPFKCKKCGKGIRKMNGLCDKCKNKDKDFIQYRDTGDESSKKTK